MAGSARCRAGGAGSNGTSDGYRMRGRAQSGSRETEQKPLDFWWYVMILVLALAVAESLIGNRHLTVDKEAI